MTLANLTILAKCTFEGLFFIPALLADSLLVISASVKFLDNCIDYVSLLLFLFFNVSNIFNPVYSIENTSNTIFKVFSMFEKLSAIDTEFIIPIFTELLGVDEHVLKEVGELCTKPDMEKEILTVSVEQLQNPKINM